MTSTAISHSVSRSKTGELKGTNLLVATGEHFYLVITVGPKGSPDDTPKRFLKSFRLVTTNRRPVVDSARSKRAANQPGHSEAGGPDPGGGAPDNGRKPAS